MMHASCPLPASARRRSRCVLAAAVLLAGCAHHKKPTRSMRIDLAASKVTQIGVNAYLWRAALDTCRSCRWSQADSNGGVIVTDWYANPTDAERADEADGHDPRPGSARRRGARRRLAPGQPERPVGRRAGRRRRPCRSSRRSSSSRPAICAAAPSPAERRTDMTVDGRRRFNPLAADARWQQAWDERAGVPRRRRQRPSPRAMCWRCSPIPRGASTWAMSATTRWATCSRATGG